MMKEKWQSLQPREQKLVQVMAAVFVVGICYFLLWQPLAQAVVDKQKKVTSYQNLVVWLTEKAAEYKAVDAGASNQNNQSLTAVVNRTAVSLGVSISRVQPQGNDLVVTVDEVPFNVLLDWLAEMSNNDRVSVQNIDVVKTETQGVVKVRRLSLGRG